MSIYNELTVSYGPTLLLHKLFTCRLTVRASVSRHDNVSAGVPLCYM